MSHILPLELICHIFSFLQYDDLYLTRGVSRMWRSMVEEHIYLDMKAQQQSVTITIGQSPFTSTLELNVNSYDTSERVVEFRPKGGYTAGTAAAAAAICPSSWQLYHHRQMQIKLNKSQSNSNCAFFSSSWFQTLRPQEQELALFHLQYNPVLECSYALPAYSWLTSSMSEQADQHYIGDKTLILSFSYIQPSRITSGESDGTLDHQHYLSSTSPSSTSLCAPQIKIHWLRVTLDWIISFTQPKIHCTQIYANRYSQFHQTLANRYGCYKYDHLSEPVLAYIIQQGNTDKDNNQRHYFSPQSPNQPTLQAIQGNNDGSIFPPVMVAPPKVPFDAKTSLPKQLLSYVQEHSHEYHTRLSRLEHMLECACVNPRMIWKYSFAKSFVVGNGSLLCEEDVVRRIQDSEEEWRLLSRTLKRRLGAL
ncbi:unnamed protein product [Absidia cylindrospora]